MTLNSKTRFTELINKLKSLVLDMFDRTVEQHELVLAMMKDFDQEETEKIIEKDLEINVLLVEATDRIIWWITRERPMARDLRRMIGYISICREIERIADYAKNFSKFLLKNKVSKEILKFIIDLLEQVQPMFILVREAIIEETEKNATKGAIYDETINDAYKKTSEAMMKLFTTTSEEERKNIVYTFQQLKYIERIGDHLGNICEFIVYIIKGKVVDLKLHNQKQSE